MIRRDFLAALAGALVGAPRDVWAQKVKTDGIPTIVTINLAGARGGVLFALQRGLKGLGYAPNNLRVVPIVLGRMPDLAQELARHRPDVIFASTPAGVRAARAAARSTPIVALDLETDPIAAGWIESFAQPGRNLTGLFLDQPALASKWLQLIKEAVPAAARIAILWDPVTGTGQLRAVEAEARSLNLQVQAFEYDEPNIDSAFGRIARGAWDAIILLSSPLVVLGRTRIAEHAVKARLPSITMFRIFAEAGGLMAYGVDPGPMAERAAAFIDKILKGQNASNIPIEQPTRFELAVNLKTAKALGLNVPLALLARADTVIE